MFLHFPPFFQIKELPKDLHDKLEAIGVATLKVCVTVCAEGGGITHVHLNTPACLLVLLAVWLTPARCIGYSTSHMEPHESNSFMMLCCSCFACIHDL